MSDELRVGRSLGRGEFHLDEDRALQKLQEFQLPSPHHYVLELVKASRLLDSRQISFSLGVQRVEVRFAGSLPRAGPLRLYSAAFANRATATDEALRHLAIGLTAARALGLREITIVVGGVDPFGVRLVDDEIEEFAVNDPPRGMNITLQKSLRPRSFLRFADRLRDQMPEEALLRERCRYSPQEILVDGVAIPKEDPFGRAMFRRPLEWGEETGEVALTRESSVTTRVLHHGVLLATEQHPSPWEGQGFSTIVDSPLLSTNLSQSAFVEDEAWKDLHRRVQLAALETLATYLRQTNALELRARATELRRLLYSIVKNLNDAPPQAGPTTPEVAAFLKTAEALPIFHDASQVPRGSLSPDVWIARSQARAGAQNYPAEKLRSLRQFRREEGLLPFLDAPTIRFVMGQLLVLIPQEYQGIEPEDFLKHFGRPELVTNLNDFFTSRPDAPSERTSAPEKTRRRVRLERSQIRRLNDLEILVGRPTSEDRDRSSLELPWLPIFVEITSETTPRGDKAETVEGLRAAQEEAFALLATNLFFTDDVDRLLQGILHGEVQRAFADAFEWPEFPEELEERSLKGLRARAVRQFGDPAEAQERERRRRREERREQQRSLTWPERYEVVRQLLITHGGQDHSSLTNLLLQRFARQDRTSVLNHLRTRPDDRAAAALAALALHGALVDSPEAKQELLRRLIADVSSSKDAAVTEEPPGDPSPEAPP